jgi:hypothetical protein
MKKVVHAQFKRRGGTHDYLAEYGDESTNDSKRRFVIPKLRAEPTASKFPTAFNEDEEVQSESAPEDSSAERSDEDSRKAKSILDS